MNLNMERCSISSVSIYVTELTMMMMLILLVTDVYLCMAQEQARATWYGDPEGDGTTGGACAYGSMVTLPPMHGTATAVSPTLFKNGEGCGVCYQIRCIGNSLCKSDWTRLTVMDECPGCPGDHLFDLSGAAFGNMAADPSQRNQLRNLGMISVEFQRINCDFGGQKTVFKIDQGSSNYWFSVLVAFEPGNGGVANVELQDASSNRQWQSMKRLWGAKWAFQVTQQQPLQPPFSIRVTTAIDFRNFIASNVIPVGWKPDDVYTAVLVPSP